MPEKLLTWSVASWIFYIVCAATLSLVVRLALSALKAFQRDRATGFCRTFGRNFKGWGGAETANDYWYPFFLGVLEFLSYPALMATGNWTFIGAWLGFKTLAQWKHWGENRPAFNRFLIGNALVLTLSLFVLTSLIKVP